MAAKKPAKKDTDADAKAFDPCEEHAEDIANILMGMHDGLSLRKACESAGVARSSFLRWVDEDPTLADQYARAREALLDFQAQELEEIGERAAAAKSAVEVSGLRLQSDNRKWLLAKLAPKKYGDRTIHQGDDEAAPIQVESTELTMTQRAARLSSLLALASRQQSAGGAKQ